jgi:hypothetical protein
MTCYFRNSAMSPMQLQREYSELRKLPVCQIYCTSHLYSDQNNIVTVPSSYPICGLFYCCQYLRLYEAEKYRGLANNLLEITCKEVAVA